MGMTNVQISFALIKRECLGILKYVIQILLMPKERVYIEINI